MKYNAENFLKEARAYSVLSNTGQINNIIYLMESFCRKNENINTKNSIIKPSFNEWLSLVGWKRVDDFSGILHKGNKRAEEEYLFNLYNLEYVKTWLR